MATHVAAHAVLAVRQGQPPEQIMVHATPFDCVGKITYFRDGSILDLAAQLGRGPIELWRVGAMADCVEYLAGPIAELRKREVPLDQLRSLGEQYYRGPVSFDRFDHSSCCRVTTDLSRTNYLVHWAFGADAASAFAAAWTNSLALVLEHWDDIVRLAAAVEDRACLSDDEIIGIIGDNITIDMRSYPTTSQPS